MDIDMETSPSNFDPEDLTIRERFRRYGKRQLPSRLSPYSASKSSEIRSNSALILENIKQEIESLGADHSEGTPAKAHSALKRRSSIDTHGIFEVDVASDSIRRSGNHSLKNCKHEDDALLDGGDTTFTLFAPLLDSALQGRLMTLDELVFWFWDSYL